MRSGHQGEKGRKSLISPNNTNIRKDIAVDRHLPAGIYLLPTCNNGSSNSSSNTSNSSKRRI